ncbi:hypothetical protein V0R37_18595 [Pollutimonas sp. H1-120]|uniref:hypothetical protein n=1 Tax=Pollutimonas sp. H1-120 TaxID=3148824 RepID=UPI003B5167A2
MTTDTVLTDVEKRRMAREQYNGDPVDFARAIEQAVLQSPEVQRLREDEKRLQYLLHRVCMYQVASYGCKFEIINLPPHFGDCEPDAVPPFVAAINAAMEKQP